MSLIGTLGEVKLADVLRLFAAGKKTGLLTVAADGQEAALRFEKGAIVHALSGRLHGEDAVLDLFGWKKGQLTFVPEEKTVTANVHRAVDALVLEGLREGERVHRMHELIPNDRVVFQLGPGPGEGAEAFPLTPPVWKVLRALDGARELREVVEASKLPRPEVMRTVAELAEHGFVERVEAKPLRVQAAHGLTRKDVAEVDERLESEWMKVPRFGRGVARVEVRSPGGRAVTVPVAFRSGLFRDVVLPRAAVADLGVHEGDDVLVRPVA